MESLISPIVESIETFLKEGAERGRRRGGKATANRPLSGRARLGIREAEAKQGGHGRVDDDDERRIDKGRLIGLTLIGVEIHNIYQGLPRWRQKRLPFFIPGNCQKVDPQGGRFKMFDLFWSLEALGGLI